MSTATFFESASEFRAWLDKNHDSETELTVGFYKVGTKKETMTWSDSVDQALCYGWIDGVRHSIDGERYQIRFTPRKANSIWSPVNIKKIETLTAQGLMKPAGLEVYRLRKEERSEVYAYTKTEVKLSPEYEQIFRANEAAWTYFQALAPSYRKPSALWVMSAKQESTQLKRLHQLIEDSAAGTNQWKDNKYKK